MHNLVAVLNDEPVTLHPIAMERTAGALGLRLHFEVDEHGFGRTTMLEYVAAWLNQRCPGMVDSGRMPWRVRLDDLATLFGLEVHAQGEGWGPLRMEGVAEVTPIYECLGRDGVGGDERHLLYFELFPQQDADSSQRAISFDSRDFHPAIVTTCRGLFVNGHFRQAVFDGCLKVNEEVRAKTSMPDLEGDALMGAAFSEQAPLLKVNALETASDKSEQRGMMFLFKGVVAAFRNPRAHSLLDSASAAEALEMLGLLSYLLRRVDTSTL